jgi:protein-disulfide isomerase
MYRLSTTSSVTDNVRQPTVRERQPTRLSLAGLPVKGSDSARFGILTLSDFACPFCARFARETLPLVSDKYLKTGEVVLAFRHHPLERIHRDAVKAAVAADCAGDQGRF